MPEYQYNPSKPEKILTGYGTVRGAELKIIYEDIEDMTPLKQIENRFGRPRSDGLDIDHIDSCLRFLRTLDMIEQTAQDVLNPLNRELFFEFDLSFEPRLLYHIRQQTDRQFHLAAIHDVATQESSSDAGHHGTRRFSVDELNIAVERHTEYDLEWREEKILMWANLFGPVGAISFASTHDEILLSPCRNLIYELLTYHQKNRENSQSLLAALQWIHQNFLPMFARTGGQPAVHVGIADVFESMVDDGTLTLTGMSDRSEVVELPKSIDDTKTPADYSLETIPDRPSYWYPLERTERRLTA